MGRRLDYQAVFTGWFLPSLFWILAVAGATLAGYPGVICITPLGWTLGLSVGTRVAAASRSPERSQRIAEAVLAGAGLGLLQGLLFAGVGTLAGMNEAGPGTWSDYLGSAVLGMLVVSAASLLVCAIMAAVMAGIARSPQ